MLSLARCVIQSDFFSRESRYHKTSRDARARVLLSDWSERGQVGKFSRIVHRDETTGTRSRQRALGEFGWWNRLAEVIL